MNTAWTSPRGAIVDAETLATPLAILKTNIAVLKAPDANTVEAVNAATSNIIDLKLSYLDLFIGKASGCIGETSAVLLLLGAAFLMYKRYIEWRIPTSFIVTVALLSWIFGF